MISTLAQISQYAAVILGVQEHRRVRYLDADENIIEGTFRHFSPSQGSAAHAHGEADPEKVWVRITTSSGFETWVQLRELVAANLDGRLGIEQ